MDAPSDARSPVELFSRPTSVFLCGNCGTILNWVAFAIASHARGGYYWTDVRHAGQLLDPLDPLARDAVPADHLSVRVPVELAPNELVANAAITAGIRPDSPVDELERLADFLRLPAPTQELISSRGAEPGPIVLVLSNAHRLAAFYPSGTVGPLIRAIVSRGVSVLFTFADTPPQGRLVFDNIWHVNAIDPLFWKEGRFRVERGDPSGPLAAGSEVRLETLPVVAPVLAGALDNPPRSKEGSRIGA